jgi:hypothetical protein
MVCGVKNTAPRERHSAQWCAANKIKTETPMQRRHLTVATLHFSFPQRIFMALNLRSSKQYIGVYYAPSLKKWRAIFGKNTKTVIADCQTELECAQRYNDYVKNRDGLNGGFLLSRVNDLPEERVCADVECEEGGNLM